MATGFARAISHGTSLVVFLVGAFGFMLAIERNKNSAAGVPLLPVFTFFMGLMLSRLVGAVLGLANGAELIMTAFAGTGAIFLGMATLSSIIKRDLSSMGKFLFIGAIMLLLVAGLANFGTPMRCHKTPATRWAAVCDMWRASHDGQNPRRCSDS